MVFPASPCLLQRAMLQRICDAGWTRARWAGAWLRSAQARRVLRALVAVLLVAGAASFGRTHWCVFQPCPLRLPAHQLVPDRILPNTSQWENLYRQPGPRPFFQQSDELRRAVANYTTHHGPRPPARVLFCGGPNADVVWQYQMGFKGSMQVQHGPVQLVRGSCATADAFDHVIIVTERVELIWAHPIDQFRMDLRHATRNQSVGVIFFGQEECMHQPLLYPFFVTNHTAASIRFYFMVYGPSMFRLANNSNTSARIMLWPLGPSYGRGIKHEDHVDDALAGPVGLRRPISCNFIGSTHRERPIRLRVLEILGMANHSHWNCHSSSRPKFVQMHNERGSDQERYVSVLHNSDFTLCPAGYNAEAYRIYEAMLLGSVPVLEYNVTRKKIDAKYHCAFTYEFIKDLNAPVVWVDDWEQLEPVMEALLRETPEQIYQRRLAVIRWYRVYKDELKRQLFHAAWGLL